MTNAEVKQAVIELLIKEFTAKKAGEKQNQYTQPYFGKIRKFIGEEVAQLLEDSPEDSGTQEALAEAMEANFKKQGFVLHAIMYHENYHSVKAR